MSQAASTHLSPVFQEPHPPCEQGGPMTVSHLTIFHSRGWHLSRLLALPRWQVLAAFHAVVLLLLALAGGLYADPTDSDPLDEISEKSIDDVLRSDKRIVVEWPEGLETREPPRPRDFPFPTLGCQTLITQADLDANLPYVIATPGTYCFVEDIDVTFPQSAVPSAIVIRASDVFLWLRGYRLRGLPSTWPPEGDGIRIEGGQSNILIDGGSMAGFNTGIWGVGLPVPLHQVRIRDMRFEEFLGVCVYLQGSTESSVAANTFTGCAIGLGVDGVMTKTEVMRNAFALNSSTFGWFQMGIYGYPSGLRIADNTFHADASLPQRYGIVLQGGSQTPIIRDNTIVRNRMYAASDPIHINDSSGPGENNTVSSNEIYGEDPWTLDPFLHVPRGNTGIVVRNDRDITIDNNRIYSSPSRSYYEGIRLEGTTTVSGQGTAHPALYDNETCAVVESLVPPSGVPLADIDGGNRWNTCAWQGTGSN